MGVDKIACADRLKVFIAKSPALADLARVADSAAQGSSCVLITGESGVGKRLFAERFHARSPRREKAFVRVNCAVLGGLLSEKDLAERFEKASDGTIFFDEVGGLAPALQEALLKLVQEKKYGARIVCSSSLDLERMAGDGKFLGSLFQRLNALSLRIPPLRERRDDIKPLADCFLKKFSDKTKKNFTGFSSEAEEAMQNYGWPGNVRELKNAVERACLFETPPVAGARGLGIASCAEDSDKGLAMQGAFAVQSGKTLKEATTEFKKYYVERALQTTGAKQADVAASLGIQRTYLSRLLVELGIRQ